MTPLDNFLRSECILAPYVSIRRSRLYDKYVQYLHSYNIKAPSKRNFALSLADYDVIVRLDPHRSKKYLQGITLRPKQAANLIVPLRDESRTPSPLHQVHYICPLIFLDRSGLPGRTGGSSFDAYVKWNHAEDERLASLLETCRRDQEITKIAELRQLLSSELSSMAMKEDDLPPPRLPDLTVEELLRPLDVLIEDMTRRNPLSPETIPLLTVEAPNGGESPDDAESDNSEADNLIETLNTTFQPINTSLPGVRPGR